MFLQLSNGQIGSSSKQPNSYFTENFCRYFKCQVDGHITSERPNLLFVSLVEEESDKEMNQNSFEIVEHSSEDDEIIYADHEEFLMLQKSLGVHQEEENDDWLWNNIFQTKCTSHDKLCNVIVDGGSFENVVSTKIVDKLILMT